MSPAEPARAAPAATPEPVQAAAPAAAPLVALGPQTALDPTRVLALQRTAGNAAVASFLAGTGTPALRRMPTAPVAEDHEITAALTAAVRPAVDTITSAPGEAAPAPASASSPAATPEQEAESGTSPAVRAPDAAPKPDAVSGAASTAPGAASPAATPEPDAVSSASPAVTAPDAASAAGPAATPKPDAVSGASPALSAPDAVSGAGPVVTSPDAASGAGPAATPKPDAVSGAGPVATRQADAVSGAGPQATAGRAAHAGHPPRGDAGHPAHGHGSVHAGQCGVHAAPGAHGHAGHAASGAHGRGGHAGPAGAEPAPVAAKVDALDSWKAAVQSSTDSIPAPELAGVKGSGEALEGKAKETEAGRKAQQPDFGAEAKAQMPAAPQPPQPAEQLDTKAADDALGLVERAGKVRLSDQAFPPMVAMPAGLAVPRPPQPAAPVTPDTVPDAITGGAGPASTQAPDPNAKAAAERLRAAGPVSAAKGPADGALLSDPGAASLDPLPPAQAELIGDAAARILAEAPAHAKEIVDGAEAKLAPAMPVASLQALAAPLLATEEAGLTAELQGVAAAAGVAGDQLKQKVAEKQAEAARLHEQADQQLEAGAARASEAVKQRGTDELQQISGAAGAVKEEVQRKEEAAKGASDPSVIDSRRDGYLEKVQTTVATASARLRAAKERRIADLQKIAGQQKAEYAHEAQAEARRAAEQAGPDETQGKIAARPRLDWGAKQALEVDGHVARLTRLATEEVERYETQIREAADEARTQIRDWAAAKQGRQRSWWEQLMDMVRDYASQAVATNQAWERQRNAETRDKVAADLTMLVQLRDDMRAGNRDAVIGEMSRLSAQERAVVGAFLRSGGQDAIGAVAAGLVARIAEHRVPELSDELEKQAIDKLAWEDLNAIGRAQAANFDAGLQAREVGASIRRIGTDEDRLFAALTGRTKIQLAAMRKAYAAIYDGDDMDDDIDSDLSGSEQDRADALRTGDPTAGAVATLRDAMAGAGTDEDLIYQTLRGKNPAERDAIVAAYEKKYGVTLKQDLKGEMSGHELGQAEALLEGDTPKADAMALKDAMDGIGTSESGIDAVYARIRDEVEAEAAAKGMKTAEVEAEIKRRNLEVKQVYGNTFADGDQNALIADFHSELSGGELKYALAEQEYDQIAMDAATLQKEHEGLWASDTKITDTLRDQYMRAHREILRDLAVDFQARSAKMTPAERAAAWEKEKARAHELALTRSRDYMRKLRADYDKDAVVFNDPDHKREAFAALIEDEVSGYDQDEARERVASGGYLSDAKELYYSIYGLGTKEARIREVMKGKSKAELEKTKREYKDISGEELAEDLEGDLSGRDEADALAILETGDASVEEKRALLHKRMEWETGKGEGVASGLALGEEERILIATEKEAGVAYATYERLRAQLGDEDPQTIAARERLERWLGYGEKDIELHREAMDRVTDRIATGAAIAVGVAVTALSGGALAPVALYFGTEVAVVSAVAGAVAATAASITVKRGLKGGAYGMDEDFVIDLAQGTAEAMIAAATFGTGAAALKALRGAPAVGLIARAAEGGLLGKLVFKGAEVSIDGLVTGLPSGMMGAILDERTWKSANPFGVILAAGGQGAGEAIKMGVIGAAAHSAVKGRGGKGRASAAPEAPVIEEIEVPESGPHEVQPEYGPDPEPVDIEPEGDSDGVPDEIHDEPSTLPHSDGVPTPVDDETSTVPHESERTGRVKRPAVPEPVTDEPGGPHIAPSDGVPVVEGGEDTAPVRDTEPHERPAREPDPAAPEPVTDEPTGRHEVPEEFIKVEDLPDGSIISGDKRPFTRREARRVYNRAIADSPEREAMVMRNVKTGERIVVQGNADAVEWDPQARDEFLAERLRGGEYVAERHYHPVRGERKVTPRHARYPSGGDLAGAEADARRTGRPHRETLDIVTENGPESLDFGYDPGRGERPYWVEVIGPDGQRVVRDFASIEGYTEWYEDTTGNYNPPPLPEGPHGRNAPPAGEGPSTRRPPPTPDMAALGEGAIVYGAEKPFSTAEAEGVYENVIADAKTEEAIVLRDMLSDECVVVQGGRDKALAPPERWADWMADRGRGGRWRSVRHYHGVDPKTKVTAKEHSLPSGAGGDMEATKNDALRDFKPTREILDIVGPDGKRMEIAFGYNQTEEYPWFVELPGKPPERFKSLAHYHLWFEVHTGVPHPATLPPVKP